MDTQKQPGIQIGQIFLVSAAFQHRDDVLQLPPDHKLGDMNLEVQIKTGVSADGKDGIVTVTVRTIEAENPVYRYAVEMAALVKQIEGDEQNMTVKEFVENNGAVLLFPFVREVVASLTSRGRFGAQWLKPTNLSFATSAPIGKPEG